MLKYLSETEVINSNLFVENEVYKLHNEIDNKSTNIILEGVKGSGKTTVLLSKEKRSLNDKDKSIYMKFDSCSVLGTGAYFDKSIHTHYYEVMFSKNLLNYVKRNYKDIFNEYFIDIECEIDKLISEIDEYIRRIYFEDYKLSRLINKGEISSRIIKLIKNTIEIDKLTLIIDKFDYTNGSNKISQMVLKEYFTLFDKSIISSVDEALYKTIDKKEYLNNLGYSFVKVDYGTNIDTIKEIIKRRLYDKTDLVDKIEDKIYYDLIDFTKGNINSILDILDYVLEMYEQGASLDYIFEKSIEAEKTYIEKMERIRQKPILYL